MTLSPYETSISEMTNRNTGSLGIITFKSKCFVDVFVRTEASWLWVGAYLGSGVGRVEFESLVSLISAL